jgi:UDP-3-O-[3-hydroxymyristoyl] glucosamine N-acyltransferase
MAQQTWKKYGGINTLEKNNHITTNSLITDNFTLRNDYLGNFVISGSLKVYDNIYVSTDVVIKGKTDISNNLTVGGNLIIAGNTYLYDNLFVSKGVVVDGNVNIYNELFLGNTKQMYLYGSSTGIGINTHSPTAILDISGSKEQILNVYSSGPINTNIIAQNQNHHGIGVSSNDVSSCIQFYNDGTVNSSTVDAKIQYILGGNLVITTGNTIVNSKFAVSNRLSKDHVFGEQAVIYDISAGPYLNNYYKKPTYNTGNALSLISDNNNSNTFLNIANPNKIGLAVGGGSIILPTDSNTRSMGTIGLTDICGNYVPVQTIVSGNNIISKRSTVGINKYNPITETYVLDINGPVHIDNGEIVNVNNIPFQINCTDSNGGFIVSVGNAAYLNTITNKYTYIINYSNNGGKTWKQYNLTDNTSNLNDFRIKFNAVYVYDSSRAIIGGDYGFMYFTNNAGLNWYSIVGIANNNNSSQPANIKSIFIYDSLNIIVAYDNYTFFTLSNISSLPSSILNINDPINSISSNRTIIPILISQLCGINSYTCFAGENVANSIVDGSGSIIIQNNSNNVLRSTPHIVSGHVYNKIKNIYDPISHLYIIIAVGNGIISSATSPIGTYNTFTFNDITNISINFKDVYIYDSRLAVACGNGSAFYYSIDGYQTWTTVNPIMLNSSGISYLLTNPNQHFVNIYMNDLNSFIITNVLPDSSSNILYCYLPNLLNHKNNQVLDVCGNMQLSGYLTVDNDVYIKEQLYVVCDSSLNGNLYVNMDSSMNGNVFIRKKLTVAYDSSLNGNLYVGLDASMGGNVFIRKKLTVAYDSSLNGNLIVGLDTTVGGNIYNKGNLFTNYIDCYHQNSLNIGTNTQPQNINIGNPNSTINITGSNVNITGGTIQNIGQLETTLHTILLNDGTTNPGVSVGSGVRIRDNGIDDAAFMLISTDMHGLLLKTTASPNVLNINTGNIQLTDSSVRVGLVTLKRSTLDVNNVLDSSFTMMAADIDVSNIMLKDWRVSDQYTQTAITNIRIFGNTDICGNLYIHNTTNSTAIDTGAFQIRKGGGASISGNLFVGGILHMDSPIIVNKLATSINPNMMMDISGNATITRLGLNLQAIDSDATLAIRGNIIQTVGFIQQF